MKRKKLAIIIITFFIISIIGLFHYISKQKKDLVLEKEKIEEDIYTSNIIDDVKYSSKDTKGNSYNINASIGEIDYSRPNIVYLTNVRALIKLANSNEIKINSDFGRYNIDNFTTIFSKNVIVKYLDNKITSEYLDFSLERNSMIISKKVVYTNPENVLKADVIEINIETKDTKIYRYNLSDKVNINSKNNNGNN
tara:strand:- start:121 stop:705 length:585 start_codon:yes stop_codon:yes gene_type:complete